MRDADVGNGATISSDGRDSSNGGATFIAPLATLRVGGGAQRDNLVSACVLSHHLAAGTK
jgi:hypothetical protein